MPPNTQPSTAKPTFKLRQPDYRSLTLHQKSDRGVPTLKEHTPSGGLVPAASWARPLPPQVRSGALRGHPCCRTTGQPWRAPRQAASLGLTVMAQTAPRRGVQAQTLGGRWPQVGRMLCEGLRPVTLLNVSNKPTK